MTDNGNPMPNPRPPEESEADAVVRGVLATALGVVAMLALVGAAVWLLLRTWAETGPAPTALLAIPPPVPLAEFRAREERLLQATEWIDRDAGIARIPVERAMALLARRARAPEGGR